MWLALLRLRVSGRMTFVFIFLILPWVMLLNGCWELAGPLIGVGAVGGGVGVAAASRASAKQRPSPTPVQESSSGSAESVPQSASSQLTVHESPAIAALPAPSPAAVPSPAAAVTEAPHRAREHRRKAKAVARSSKPKRLKSRSPSVASSLLTAPPDTLPSTAIVH